MLDLENIDAYYDESHILHGVSLTVRKGEVVCLLGRNGAGKTTTILTIMGYLHPRARHHTFQRTGYWRTTALCSGAAWIWLRATRTGDLPQLVGAREFDRIRPGWSKRLLDVATGF